MTIVVPQHYIVDIALGEMGAKYLQLLQILMQIVHFRLVVEGHLEFQMSRHNEENVLWFTPN